MGREENVFLKKLIVVYIQNGLFPKPICLVHPLKFYYLIHSPYVTRLYKIKKIKNKNLMFFCDSISVEFWWCLEKA